MTDLQLTQEARMALAELVSKAAGEWLEQVAELAVEDLVVDDLADHIAARVLYGWPERELRLVVDTDPTPAHGITRPSPEYKCLACHPRGYLCTLDEDHTGLHEAHGTNLDDNGGLYATWSSSDLIPIR